MLLGFDGVERYSGESSEKITRKIEGQENDSILNELAVISNEGINVFGKEGDINQHAYLTKQSRDLKISLNPQGNNERTQQLIEATERAGSWAVTRVMGAGGGFFVCWAPKYRHDEIKTSVKVRTWVDVKFNKTGSQVIFAE